MPLMKSKSKAAFKQNVGAEMKSGKPQDQALAIAYSVKRRAPKKMSDGGMVDEDNEAGYRMPDDSPLLHDEHEDFLTDYDDEDPFNERPESQPSDSMHEEVDSEPPGNTDGGAEEESLLSQLMRRRRSMR